MHRVLVASCLVGCLGCASTPGMTHYSTVSPATVSPATVSPATVSPATVSPAIVSPAIVSPATASPATVSKFKPPIQTVAWVGPAARTETHPVYPVEQAEAANSGPVRVLPTAYTSANEQGISQNAPLRETPAIPEPLDSGPRSMGENGFLSERQLPQSPGDAQTGWGNEPRGLTDASPAVANNQLENTMPLNLPTALAMVDGSHPAVGFARWRVQEAYAQLASAQVLWLPSIQAGFSFNRHDGNLQASDGNIIDVNRNSFQYGLGAGAVGAGTVQRPGLIAQFHLADAIFQPKISEKTAWARGHAASAVTNRQLMTAAVAYLDLLSAYQAESILQESQQRMSELAKLTRDFAASGEGLQADADRLRTELILVADRKLVAAENIAVASARLAQAISSDAGCRLVPTDVTALPLQMTVMNTDECSLVSIGLTTRPELKESQALVAAACEAYRREKYAPFVPSALLGVSSGGFGGGLGNDLSNVEGRIDFDALMSWQVRNLGFGERAVRRESAARIQQAKFSKVRVMDQVAREILEAFSQVQVRAQRISTLEPAIQSARDSYDRSLARIRDGQGIPLEVLQSVQALETAQRAYLSAVIEHNQAQFRLQWALGWPVSEADQKSP